MRPSELEVPGSIPGDFNAPGGVFPYSMGGGVPLGSRKSYPLPD